MQIVMEVVINATSRRTNIEDELAFSERRREPAHYAHYLRAASPMQMSRVEFTPIARSLPLVQTLRVKSRRSVYALNLSSIPLFFLHRTRDALEKWASQLRDVIITYLSSGAAPTAQYSQGVWGGVFFSGLAHCDFLPRAKLRARNVNVNRHVLSVLRLVWRRCIPSCAAMSSCYRITTRPIEPEDCAMHAPHSREWHAKNQRARLPS